MSFNKGRKREEAASVFPHCCNVILLSNFSPAQRGCRRADQPASCDAMHTLAACSLAFAPRCAPRYAPVGPCRSNALCSFSDTELLALSLPGGPSIDLKPEDVVLACCRGLQHPDVPTANCGLERLFHFTTYECRASLTGRRGSSGGNGCEADCAAHLDNFVREGADSLSLARSLFPLIHCPTFSVGEPTRIEATQTRGAIASMVVAVRAAEAFRHPSGYAKGEQAAESLYAASSMGNELVRFTLQQERRPPLQDCWLVKEILPARLHDMENKYTWV